jgi:hypothetical protein
VEIGILLRHFELKGGLARLVMRQRAEHVGAGSQRLPARGGQLSGSQRRHRRDQQVVELDSFERGQRHAEHLSDAIARERRLPLGIDRGDLGFHQRGARDRHLEGRDRAGVEPLFQQGQ